MAVHSANGFREHVVQGSGSSTSEGACRSSMRVSHQVDEEGVTVHIPSKGVMSNGLRQSRGHVKGGVRVCVCVVRKRMRGYDKRAGAHGTWSKPVMCGYGKRLEVPMICPDTLDPEPTMCKYGWSTR